MGLIAKATLTLARALVADVLQLASERLRPREPDNHIDMNVDVALTGEVELSPEAERMRSEIRHKPPSSEPEPEEPLVGSLAWRRKQQT